MRKTLFILCALVCANVSWAAQYQKLGSVDQLHAGDTVLFVNPSAQMVNGPFETKTSTKNTYLTAVGATFVGSAVSVTAEAYPFVLGKSNGAWTFTGLDGAVLGKKATGKTNMTKNKGCTTHTITFRADSVVIVTNTDGDGYFIRYNVSSFRYYKPTSAVADAYLYRFTSQAEPLPIAVEGVELDYVAVTLREGETDILTATVYPEDAAIQDVEWGSTNETVATVVDGQIQALTKGETQIWVRTIDGGFTDTCQVTVMAGLNQPDVTWNQVQDLSLLTEGTKVFIASERTGEDYVLGIYDYEVAKANIRGAAATFSNDHHAVTASASYAYTVSIVNGKYVFSDLDGMYLCDYNSKNLSTQDTLDNKAKWTVTMDEMFIVKIANQYNTGYEIYNNHNNDLFCCYNAFDKSNMSHLVIYSDNAPAWVEPIRIPELTITVDKDTITDSIDFGEVVYDDSWGTEVNPYEAAKTLKFTAKWLTEDIALALYKGSAFTLYTESISKDGGSASVQFSVKQKGTYEDTLYVNSGDITRKILLTAKTVTQEEAAPQLTLSTTAITLNPNLDNDLTDNAEMTFSVKNLVKPLYIKWEKGEIPEQAGEDVTIFAGNEAANIDFGAATNMGTTERTNETILFEASGYTPGTYVSTLCFYTPDAVDKSKNAFEQRVTITIIITK
ncbi:MAG: Ig domain-containing protein, partial [Bacteroidales bacterium]|nr:Ig domain-containing protein [Candidatus Colicola caccequi]